VTEQECPPFVLRFARAHLYRSEEPAGRRRSWLSRLLRPPPNTFTPWADVRWFSECDVASKTCAGFLLGRWLVGIDSVDAVDLDFRPGAVDEGGGIDKLLDAIVVNFAVTPLRDAAVLHFVPLHGDALRFAARLPQGPATPQVTPDPADTVTDAPRRDARDLCLPAGWRPRPIAGRE
jgi:hypothetical protein